MTTDHIFGEEENVGTTRDYRLLSTYRIFFPPIYDIISNYRKFRYIDIVYIERISPLHLLRHLRVLCADMYRAKSSQSSKIWRSYRFPSSVFFFFFFPSVAYRTRFSFCIELDYHSRYPRRQEVQRQSRHQPQQQQQRDNYVDPLPPPQQNRGGPGGRSRQNLYGF